MVVEYVRYRVPGQRTQQFLQAYAQAGPVLEADLRCLGYDISRGVEEPERFVVRIEWTSVADHLEGFRRSPAFAGFFAAVQPFFADIEEMAHYERQQEHRPVQQDDVPSLFEWAGGATAFPRLIEAFYDRVESDDLLSGLFPGGVTREHREAVARWWAEVFGGPSSYSEQGGYPRMLAHHRNLAITAEQRLRFATLMSLAADDARLPADPEFRAAFVGYVEWGTRLAMDNSRPDADPVPDAPVPRWGWGVAPPYLG